MVKHTPPNRPMEIRTHPLAKGTASGVVHSKHGEPVEEGQDQRRQ